jgi:aminoglycoside phosphotransferase family enzyme/predicted kinase
VARERARRKQAPADALPAALCDPRCYGAGVEQVRLVQTHVSWVFLTGRFAYKVKKPVKLPFVDFSTLALRRHYCREELRVNRRLAPQLYLAVVPIGGTRKAPRIGRTPAFEYAVKMREFPADARLDRALEKERVSRAAIADFGARLAQFHEKLRPVRGIAAEEMGPAALANIDELAAYLSRSEQRELAALRAWTEQRGKSLLGLFAQRAKRGAHRECHGDLHLQNLLVRNGAVMAFDALEFDRKLRDIDVMSEAAFVAMDLQAHGHRDLACAFVNRYLEISGDYEGLEVLPFYLVQRALVRAKVAAIKSAQGAADGHDRELYLATALELTRKRKPLLVITHGLSGSGKTTITDELVSLLPALRARSDLERKRLHGLRATARTGSSVGAGLYAAASTRQTYTALAEIADRILRSGHDALIDATFLRRSERLEFRQVAAMNAARFAILDCTATADELRRRVRVREEAGRDASEANLAVLEHQLLTHEPLDGAERRVAVRVDTERPLQLATIAAQLRRI